MSGAGLVQPSSGKRTFRGSSGFSPSGRMSNVAISPLDPTRIELCNSESEPYIKLASIDDVSSLFCALVPAKFCIVSYIERKFI